MVWLIVNVLKVPGNQAVESRVFAAGAVLPSAKSLLGAIGLDWPDTPLNLAFVLALAACVAVWLLLWHTRLGHRLRVVGQSADAARYAGISPQRMTIVALSISGALAALAGANEIAGVHHKLLLDFVAGAGFTGIAVALMGRNHPVGIALAALLFGALSQGGSELVFEMPAFTRDMSVAVQGFVVLFCGALSLTAAWPGRARLRLGAPTPWMTRSSPSPRCWAPRCASPCRWCCARWRACSANARASSTSASKARCWPRAFAAACLGAIGWPALAALAGAVAVAMLFSAGARLGLHHAPRRPDRVRGRVERHRARPDGGAGPGLVPPGRTHARHRRGQPLHQRAPRCRGGGAGTGRWSGRCWSKALVGHNALVWLAFALVPAAWWLLYRTRFGLRLRAVGENPAMVDAAGISVTRLRYGAVLLAGLLCGIAGAYLTLAQNASFSPGMTAGRGFMALAAMVFGQWHPLRAGVACLLFGFLDAVAIRLQGVSLPGIGAVPVELIQALPYALTVVLLAGFFGRAQAPRALGIAYVKER